MWPRRRHWRRSTLLSLLVSALAVGCHDLALDLVFLDASQAPGGTDGGPGSTVIHCSTQAQCADAAAPLCNVEAGACVNCLSNADCSGSTPHCLRGGCVSCTGDADCSPGMVCNTHIPRCATSCMITAQCSAGKQLQCATDYGYCVECLGDYDCQSQNIGLPFCYEPPAVGLCVECRTSTDCKVGQICGPSERCANP